MKTRSIQSVLLTVAMFFALTTTAQAGNQCSTPWANHGVYETTVFYGIDEVVPEGEGPFLPMDIDRNTKQYRKRAFRFFRDQFGVTFDPVLPGDQIAVDPMGRTAVMQPVKLGLGSTHQVYGIDAQRIPQWRSRMPLTKIALRDDGYFVFVGDEGFTVNGVYGGEAGVTLPPGTVFLLGEYRMFDQRDRLLDTIEYFSETPAFPIVVPGTDLPTTQFTISCRVSSELFGEGDTRALGSLVTLPDGSTDLDFRYTMQFPSRLRETDLDDPKCRRLPRLRN